MLAIWRKFGAAIKVIPFVLIAIVLVYSVHGDYLQYAEVSESKDHLALSFLVKWAAIALVIAIYWLYVKKVLQPEKKSSLRYKMTRHVSRNRSAENDEKKRETFTSPEPESGTSESDIEAPDPFKSLRQKKHLRSRAELIIEKGKDAAYLKREVP